MGNRAVIINEECGIGVYLHWNGGPDSVYAFLDYAKAHDRKGDAEYGMARLVQFIGNFFGGNSSVGVFPAKIGEDYAATYGTDNGAYYVNDHLEVIRRTCGEEMTAEQIIQEEQEARASSYWTNDKTILDQLHEKNKMHL